MTKNRRKASKTNLSPSAQIKLIAKNEHQSSALQSIDENTVSVVYGAAGTGKTHLAVAYGLQRLQKGEYNRLVFTRPCIESYGENLGFLPGDFNEKIEPYMIPIFDICSQYLEADYLAKLIEKELIVTLPLAFQRGVTFRKAFVVADEMQNAVPQQVRMLLTRMGRECKIVLTGDPSQTDISVPNGLQDAIKRLAGIEGIGIVEMGHSAIVRHPLVEAIDKRYHK